MNNGFILFHTTLELPHQDGFIFQTSFMSRPTFAFFFSPLRFPRLNLLVYFVIFSHPSFFAFSHFQLKSESLAPETCRSVSWPTAPSD